ncbi:hypothetical protein HIM_09563 [Hirsutella minnesotensis 3608]|uniref:ubiquitinyl hydrolase 1 n=1 Tax=Hirsutella minnesotensis 3608 TaxID=1043627 RepID=A0A0F7ZGK2_9HYPO|nr:hypothetical protein HIM_09563 [Hirsutella minnesotensis 3608]
MEDQDFISREPLGTAACKYLVEHVFLPPRLQCSPDAVDAPNHETHLLDLIIKALESLRAHISDARDQTIICEAECAIKRFRETRDERGFVRTGSIKTAMEKLCSDKEGAFVPIHVKQQNAGLLLIRTADSLVVETMELSPPSKKTLETIGRLKRRFPDTSCELNSQSFADTNCRSALSDMIETLSNSDNQPRKGTQPESEEVCAKRVTVLLAAIVDAMGKKSKNLSISKKTREEFLGSKDEGQTWRRSPLWLLVRVSLQLHFSNRPSKGRSTLYKRFMIFLKTLLLNEATKLKLASDLCHCMISKLGRRLFKLGRLDDGTFLWPDEVERAWQANQDYTQAKWRDTCARENAFSKTQFEELSHEDIAVSKQISHPNFARYGASDGPCPPSADVDISVLELDMPSLRITNENMPWISMDAGNNDCWGLPFRLLQFEDWVDRRLDSWIQHNIERKTACADLNVAMQRYWMLAEKHYHWSPVSSSRAILTCLDLFKAADQAACRHHELLRKYDPKMPFRLFQALHVPSKRDMERLRLVEEYFVSREDAAKFDSPCVYTSWGKPRCFAALFFDSSEHHQKQLLKIKEESRSQEKAKMEEFRKRKAEYRAAIAAADRLEHDREAANCTEHVRGSMDGSSATMPCAKCKKNHEANNMKIKIYEKPLPELDVAQKSIVFELDVPQPFRDWRDMSTHVRVEILQGSFQPQVTSQPQQTPQPQQESQLQENEKKMQGRADLLATHPSYEGFTTLVRVAYTKRREHEYKICYRVDNEDDWVVKQDKSRYYYFYGVSDPERLLSSLEETDRLSEMLCYRLSERHASLQDFLHRPHDPKNALTPNDSIQRQFSRPDTLSREEFRSMASILFGYCNKWMNVAITITSPDFDLDDEDAVLILLQASGQAGPRQEASGSDSRNSACRPGHQHLADASFASLFVKKLNEAANRMLGGSTKPRSEMIVIHRYAMIALVGLGCRVLALSNNNNNNNHQVSCDSLSFLKSYREAACKSLRHLIDDGPSCDNAETKLLLQRQIFEVSQVCVGTFDVDDDCLLSILELEEQAGMLIEASIAIERTRHRQNSQNTALNTFLLHRWQQVNFRAQPLLRKLIVEQRKSCLNKGIRILLPSVTDDPEWSQKAPDVDYLLRCRAGMADGGVHVLDYNLLTSELFVDGYKVSGLPTKFEQLPRCDALFGKFVPEIERGKLPGVLYSSREPYHGYALQFSVKQGPSNDPSLTATEEGDNVWELVDPKTFESSFPDAFVHEYVHWYNAAHEIFEFRPLAEPWQRSPNNWRLRKEKEGSTSWLMENGNETLLHAATPGLKGVSKALRALESVCYMRFTWLGDNTTGSIQVALPRLNLDFSLTLRSTKLFCKQYQGMYVDHEQDIQTLIGLQSKLVLKNDHGQRKVLVPDGECSLSWSEENHHVSVSIVNNSSSKVHVYEVDELLGRLKASGDLQDNLKLCYLHALTSHTHNDPLTKKTGTQSALDILNSGAVTSRSPASLTRECLELLDRIARLSPGRSEYPYDRGRLYESIDWNENLSFLSQHHQFYTRVQDILRQSKYARVLEMSQSIQHQDLDWMNQRLHMRHAIRASSFQRSRYGAEDDAHKCEKDRDYRAQVATGRHQRFESVLRTAKAIHDGKMTLSEEVKDDFVTRTLELFKSIQVLGRKSSSQSSRPFACYSQEWQGPFKETMRAHWCNLFHSLGNKQLRPSRYHVMICLGSIAFSQDCDSQLLQALVACYTNPVMGRIDVPNESHWNLAKGWDIRDALGEIQKIITPFIVFKNRCPDAQLSAMPGESPAALEQRRTRSLRSNRKAARDQFEASLKDQWDSRVESPSRPVGGNIDTYINVEGTMTKLKSTWEGLCSNRRFRDFVITIADTLKSIAIENSSVQGPGDIYRPGHAPLPSLMTSIAVKDFVHGPAPNVEECTDPKHTLLRRNFGVQKDNPLVAKLVERLYARNTSACQDVARNLEKSSGLWSKRPVPKSLKKTDDESLGIELEKIKKELRNIYEEAFKLFPKHTGISPARRAIDVNRQASRSNSLYLAMTFLALEISPSLIIEQLSWRNWGKKVPSDWQEAILKFGQIITQIKRVDRMLAYASAGDGQAILNELLDTGSEDWDPLQQPAWLLLEVESGMMIRKDQAPVAKVMCNPRNNKNSVMQMNMGQGKTSMIIPMCAASLSNGTRLVRVVASKSQMKEVCRILTERLGGLVDQQVCVLSVSRQQKLTESEAQKLLDLVSEWKRTRTILVMQPAHILSPRLKAFEVAIQDGIPPKDNVYMQLLNELQDARDLVDECDENMGIRNELVYPIGQACPLEMGPARWRLLAKVLELFATAATKIHQLHPEAVHIKTHSELPGSFPEVGILRPDGVDLLIGELLTPLVKSQIPERLAVMADRPDWLGDAVTYISKWDLSDDEIAAAENLELFSVSSTKQGLLLLRGLFACGLSDVFLGTKALRYRVNFGLVSGSQSQARIATPFYGKDRPAIGSEYANIEVSTILTLVSYYRKGLSDEDLFNTLDQLARSDLEGEAEYESWVEQASKIPEQYRRLSELDLENKQRLITELFPHLKYLMRAVNYFVGRVVLQDVRRFPNQLSASSPELVRQKKQPLTGFSGTKESNLLLPLGVEHIELEEQNHADAEVLGRLLHGDNIVVEHSSQGSEDSAEAYLKSITSLESPIQVVLDVGAQILWTNVEFAQAWLRLSPSEKEAVVFFDDDDELCVIDRQGHIAHLRASSYAQQLGVCLVYLDEAHTRGTDLRLPANYKAFVTLSPCLNKDKLAQAGMRMRRLGEGQSLVYFVPEDTQIKLREVCRKEKDSAIEVIDVIFFTIMNTLEDLRNDAPLWAKQQERFLRHDPIVTEALRDPDNFTKEKARQLVENESLSLEEQYGPIRARQRSANEITTGKEADQHRKIQERLKLLGVSEAVTSAKSLVQHTRETVSEFQQERQVESPPEAEAEEHDMHEDVIAFATSGSRPSASAGIMPAFRCLENTSVAKAFGLEKLPSHIFVTQDYSRTVRITDGHCDADCYQRPVEWILTSTEGGVTVKTLIIISPYEAQELMLKASRKPLQAVKLHRYSPRTKLRHPATDSLREFVMPSLGAD